MLFWVLKSAVVFLIAGLATWGMRRRSAASRHLLWVWAFMVVGMMPLVSAFIPQRVVPVYRGAAAVTRHLPPALLPPEVRPNEEVTVSVANPPTEINPWWVIYGFGIVIGAGRLTVAFLQLRRVARSRTPLAGGDTLVHKVPGLTVPITFGQRRPMILLPEDADRWDAERLDVVVRHERAHVERRDWVWQCLALGICLVQWFNPAGWLAFRALRLEAERATDDQVLAEGISSSLYAQTLIEFSQRGMVGGIAALPMARKSGLFTRIQAITKDMIDRSRPGPRMRRALSVAATLTCGLLASVAVSFAVPDELLWPTAPERGLEEGQISTVRPSKDSPFCFQAIQRRLPSGKVEAWSVRGERIPAVTSDFPARQCVGRKVRWFMISGPEVVALPSPDYVDLGQIYDAPDHRTLLCLAFRPELKMGFVRVQTKQPIWRTHKLESTKVPDEIARNPLLLIDGSAQVGYPDTFGWFISPHPSSPWFEPPTWRWPVSRNWTFRLPTVALDPLPIDQYSADAKVLSGSVGRYHVNITAVREGNNEAPARVWGVDGRQAFPHEFPYESSISSQEQKVAYRDILLAIDGLRASSKPFDAHVAIQMSDEERMTLLDPAARPNTRTWTYCRLQVPSNQKVADFRIGIAEGEWKVGYVTAAVLDEASAMIPAGRSGVNAVGRVSYQLRPAMQRKDWQAQLLDAMGNEIPEVSSGVIGLSDKPEGYIIFAIDAKRVPAYVKVRYREFQWVDFHNVAMQPAIN